MDNPVAIYRLHHYLPNHDDIEFSKNDPLFKIV